MIIEYIKNYPIVVFIVIITIIYLVCSFGKNEGLVDMPTMLSTPTYNPNLFQPGMANEIKNNNFEKMNQTVEPPWSNKVEKKADYGKVDSLSPVRMGLNYNLCSKSCCSQQWPVPFSLAPDKLVKDSGKEYVPSSYTCNNSWQDSGCLCMEKDQALFLESRGTNSFE
jgi:hypothetical protein